MSESGKEQIVPGASGKLARRSAALVRRGLDDLERQALAMARFTQSYLGTAVLCASKKIGQERAYNIADISPVTRLQMDADCQRFQQENAELLMQFRKEIGWNDPEVEDHMFGEEFWFARNHEWPRLWSGEFHKSLVWKIEDHPESIGYALIEAAKRYGEFPLYFGMDNKLYHVGHG